MDDSQTLAEFMLEDTRTLADFGSEFETIQAKLNKLAGSPTDHTERARVYTARAAVYREFEALFTALARSSVSANLMTVFMAAHSRDHYQEWAAKYDTYAASARERAAKAGS